MKKAIYYLLGAGCAFLVTFVLPGKNIAGGSVITVVEIYFFASSMLFLLLSAGHMLNDDFDISDEE